MFKEYIHLYKTNAEFEAAYNGNDYDEPWVSVTDGDASGRVNYNKTEREKMRETPLTFEILSDGVIYWGDYLPDSEGAMLVTIEYSKDSGETWTELPIISEVDKEEIEVQRGETVMFRGDNATYSNVETFPAYACFMGSSCHFNLKGNIMSLISSTNFQTLTSFPDETSENLCFLFSDCTGLTDASMLILPATTLSPACYATMFAGCTSLVTAPELPATTLDGDCYRGMFAGCTSLVTAPELPATTLVNTCYASMFAGCTSLVTAPELPATTLTDNCYDGMFRGCTSLNYIKALFTTTPVDGYTYNWVGGVAATGTFVKNSAATWNVTGNNGVPTGWTVETA